MCGKRSSATAMSLGCFMGPARGQHGARLGKRRERDVKMKNNSNVLKYARAHSSTHSLAHNHLSKLFKLKHYSVSFALTPVASR